MFEKKKMDNKLELERLDRQIHAIGYDSDVINEIIFK